MADLSSCPITPVRFATIGTNFIVDAFLDAASGLEGFAHVAVYSRTERRAAEFVRKRRIAHATTFTDLDALARAPGIDAVYVASPTSEHARQATTLLRGGKHVLCEKPACSHAGELAAVLDCARASGKAFVEAMRPLRTPAFAAVREAAARIGPTRQFVGTYCQRSSRWPAYLRGERPNAFLPEFSNGALMDLGCYAVYSAVALLGKPARTEYAAAMLPTGVASGGTILLRYEHGAVATLVISKSAHGWNWSELQGEDGTVRINHLGDYAEAHLRRKGGETEPLCPRQPSGHANMVHEIDAFLKLVRLGKQEDDVLTWRLALDVAEVLDAARDSAGIVFPADASRKLRSAP